MRTIALDGEEWSLSAADRPDERIQAEVPGNVQLDLWRAGMLPDPYVGRNAERYCGLEEKTWTYRCGFGLEDASQCRAWYLVFEGVDYHARFSLNGQDIGEHEGQFGRIVFEVSELLGRSNELQVTILPVPKSSGKPRAKVNPSEPPRHDGRWLVKSLMSFGWDFAPSLIPVGIWQSVHLIGTAGPLLHSPRVDMEFNQGLSRVALTFLAEYTSTKATRATLHLCLLDPSGQPAVTDEQAVQLRVGEGCVSIRTQLAEPRLWWPNGYGPAPVYQVRLELTDGGATLAELEHPVGMRTVSMVRSRHDQNEGHELPAGPHNSETCFVVNGRPIYYRGCNLVPPDILFGRLSEQRLRGLVEMAHQANVNLLRIWGGGVVLPDAFYRCADQAGILIWQEFPLGCTDHAGSEHYRCTLEREAESIVKKLRHHPCLAIWCGGNELFQDHSGMAPQDRILRMLAAICYDLDPDRPFVATSPYHGVRHGPYTIDGLGAGGYGEPYDHVQWCNALPPAAYNECGISGAGHAQCMRSVLPAEELWPPRPGGSWEYHKAFGVWGDGSAWLMLNALQEYFGPLEDVDQLARAGQFMQMIQLQYLVEELRRRWPDVPGHITWCFNEPWTPVANCSVVAYPLRPKAAYYALQRACRPVDVSARLEHLVLLTAETTSVTPFLVNDSPQVVAQGRVTVTVQSDSGRERIVHLALAAPAVEPGTRHAMDTVEFTVPEIHDDVLKLTLCWTVGQVDIPKEYWLGIGQPSGRPRRDPNRCFRPILSTWRHEEDAADHIPQ